MPETKKTTSKTPKLSKRSKPRVSGRLSSVAVPCVKGTADIGCSIHGYAKCGTCRWVSPNRRPEVQAEGKCALCARASGGFTYCKACEETHVQDGVEALQLFDEHGNPS